MFISNREVKKQQINNLIQGVVAVLSILTGGREKRHLQITTAIITHTLFRKITKAFLMFSHQATRFTGTLNSRNLSEAFPNGCKKYWRTNNFLCNKNQNEE